MSSGMRDNLIRGFLQDENGATAIEYALIGSIVSISIVGGLTQISTDLQEKLINVSSYFSPSE